MSLDTARAIILDIQRGNIKPIYFLAGEEPFYIDMISGYIEKTVLSEDEKGFNQMVLYGRDAEVEDIISNAKRYPMMAQRQVIIVKEAQDLSRTIDNLGAYAQNPQPTTVLVLCYKHKKLDGRKSLGKHIKSHGVYFEGKKMYDNQVPRWITDVLSKKGYSITPKASLMLTEFLGNDLGKIMKELEKLEVIIRPGQQITPQIVEENIGISKDFNNFELQNAIGSRNIKKAFAIAKYFGQNSSNHPLLMTTAILYMYFSKVLMYHALPSKGNAAKDLGITPYFIKDYEMAARNYSMKKVGAIIHDIRMADVKAKGVGSASASDGELLNELLFKIFS